MGGFESILKRMVPGNFDWFLHTMIFYHTRYVLKKQQNKRENIGINDDESDEDEGPEVEAWYEVIVLSSWLPNICIYRN